MQVQIGHIFALHNPQGIKAGFLMATEAVRTDELNNFNLLALVLKMNATRARCRCWARLTATQ